VTLNQSILQAYEKAKGSENFKYKFDDELAKALQEGLEITLKQRQLRDLTDKIWYTSNLMKGRQIKTEGQWLKMAAQVTEKYLLENIDTYKRAPLEGHQLITNQNNTIKETS
tara:strand:+ start:844 stop:1179 length:336 start_codon:yes stop_codon:yes gene_type:complete